MNYHDPFSRLSDDALMAAERTARMKAWDAPKSLPGAYNDAHARFGEEWCQLHREVKRRGLSPSTDDPSFVPKSRDETMIAHLAPQAPREPLLNQKTEAPNA